MYDLILLRYRKYSQSSGLIQLALCIIRAVAFINSCPGNVALTVTAYQLYGHYYKFIFYCIKACVAQPIIRN